jgi:hypothetical protein
VNPLRRRRRLPRLELILVGAGCLAAAPLAATGLASPSRVEPAPPGVASIAPLPDAGGPIAVQPFPGAMVSTLCLPPAASVRTARGEFRLPSSSTCYSLETTTGARGILSGDVPPPSLANPPLFVVRRGEIVRFRFSAAPQSVVGLEVLRGRNLRIRGAYRLSPFVTSWRARGTGGVMVLSASFAPATTPWGGRVGNDGAYVARFVVR